MSSWKEDMARTIRGLKDEDWEETGFHIPTGTDSDGTVSVKVKGLTAEVDSLDFRDAFGLVNRINRDEFCLAPARTLLITGFKTVGGKPPTLHFLLRSVPWDHAYDPRSAEFRAIVDSAGKPLFDTADFDEDIKD